jgi:hypothetical protein
MKQVGGLLLLTAGMGLCAESLSAPVAGYITGAVKPELRAILGVPGAFRFSEPLALPEGITRIRLAPGRDFALVERAETGLGVLILRAGEVERVVPVEGTISQSEWAVFSGAGTAAMLYSSQASRLEILTGLPDEPRVAAELDSASLPELPITAAVSDDGSLVLVGTAQAVYLVSRSEAPRLIFSGAEILSVAVLRNGRDALVSDRGAGSLHVVENAGLSPASRVAATGLTDMGQVALSHDGVGAYVSRPAAGAIAFVNLSTGELRSTEAGVAPITLLPLRNRDTFLISERPRQPGWVFYREGEGGRVVFIPAVRAPRELAR